MTELSSQIQELRRRMRRSLNKARRSGENPEQVVAAFEEEVTALRRELDTQTAEQDQGR